MKNAKKLFPLKTWKNKKLKLIQFYQGILQPKKNEEKT